MFMMWVKNLCRVIPVVGMVFFASHVNAIYTFPNYMNNSKCLLDGNQVGCILPQTISSGENDLTLLVPETYRVTTRNGVDSNVRVYWDPNSEMSSLMKVLFNDQPGWKPVQTTATSAQNDNYVFNFSNGRDELDKLAITAEAELLNPSTGETKRKKCSGQLYLSTQYYNNSVGSATGIWCYSEDKYFVNKIFLDTPAVTMKVKVNNALATERMVRIPPLWIGMMADGFNATNGSYQNPYQHNFAKLSNATFLRFNDRQCKLDIPSTERTVTFQNLQATPQGKKKLEEKSTPFKVTCAGYQDTGLNTPDQMRYGLGISNDLVGVKIRSTSGYHENNQKTIGLKSTKADGSEFIRKDLYVEASLNPGQDCSANSLMTDGTTNKFSSKIHLSGQTESAEGASTIYWKLCTPSTTESLSTGAYKGSAMISVEYQ